MGDIVDEIIPQRLNAAQLLDHSVQAAHQLVGFLQTAKLESNRKVSRRHLLRSLNKLKFRPAAKPLPESADMNTDSMFVGLGIHTPDFIH